MLILPKFTHSLKIEKSKGPCKHLCDKDPKVNSHLNLLFKMGFQAHKMTTKLKINSLCKFLHHMGNKLKKGKPRDCFPGLSFTCEIFFSHAWLSERGCFLSLHILLEETGVGSEPECKWRDNPFGQSLSALPPCQQQQGVDSDIRAWVFSCSNTRAQYLWCATFRKLLPTIKIKKRVINSWSNLFKRRTFPSPPLLDFRRGIAKCLS